VPISNALYLSLSEYALREHSIWFFSSPTGKRWDPDNFSQNLRDINKAHRLRWTCLDFRHTFSSHLAQRGVSLYKIATLMGNSPEICRRYYAALVPEEMKGVVEFTNQKETMVTHDETNRMPCEILDQLKGGQQPSSHKPNLRLIHLDSSA